LIHHLIIAAGLTLASADISAWQPTQLVARFSDGTEQRWATTNRATCEAGIEAYHRQLIRIDGERPDEPASLWCEAGDLFRHDDKIDSRR